MGDFFVGIGFWIKSHSLCGQVSNFGFSELFGLLLDFFIFTSDGDTLEIKELFLMNVFHLLSTHELFEGFVVVSVE